MKRKRGKNRRVVALEVTDIGLIKVPQPAPSRLVTETTRRLREQQRIDATLAFLDGLLPPVHGDEVYFDPMIVAAAVYHAGHRFPPRLANALQALLQEVTRQAYTRDDDRYTLVRALKEEGKGHDDACDRAAELLRAYGPVSGDAVKKSYTIGKRRAAQRRW
jgi:hypothetical protein